MGRIKFGQNFLIDENIAKKIVNGADLTSEDIVVEIGPGKGILTKFIQPQVKHLIAIEIDRNLCGELKNKFNSCTNLEIINHDFLTWSPPYSPRTIKYIANLPYCIVSPVLRKLFQLKNWSLAVFTVQKEVGERILAKPETKDYGMLSLLTEFYAGGRKIAKIPPGCFYPKPKVDSMVIRFYRKDINYSEKFINELFEVISAAFKNRRKTILNSFNLNLKVDAKFDTHLKNLLKEALSSCHVQTNERAENISLDKYIQLTQYLQRILD